MQSVVGRHAQPLKRAPAKSGRPSMVTMQRRETKRKPVRASGRDQGMARAVAPARRAPAGPAVARSRPFQGATSRVSTTGRIEPRPQSGRKVNQRLRPKVVQPPLRVRMQAAAQQGWQRLVTVGRALVWLLLRLGLVAAVVGMVWGLPKAIERLNPVIEQVAVHGTLNRLEQQHLQRQLEQVARGRFFTIDLEAVRAPLLGLPWIRSVEVKRIWPAAIAVTVVEQQPVARWGERGLLNDAGEPFYPPSIEGYEQLPMLAGPTHLGKEILARYQQIRQRLELAGVPCRGLGYDPAAGWWLRLDGEIKVQLGSRDIEQRIDHLASLLRNSLKPALSRVAAIDMRYPSAAAVRWREQN